MSGLPLSISDRLQEETRSWLIAWKTRRSEVHHPVSSVRNIGHAFSIMCGFLAQYTCIAIAQVRRAEHEPEAWAQKKKTKDIGSDTIASPTDKILVAP